MFRMLKEAFGEPIIAVFIALACVGLIYLIFGGQENTTETSEKEQVAFLWQTFITESGKDHMLGEFVNPDDDPPKWVVVRDEQFQNEYWFRYELRRPCQKDNDGVVINNPPN